VSLSLNEWRFNRLIYAGLSRPNKSLQFKFVDEYGGLR